MHRRILSAFALGGLAAIGCSGPTEPTPIATIQVTASSTTLASGATIQLTAATYSKDGKPLADRVVTWSSSNQSTATVSSAGLVSAGRILGGSAETATITAAAEGIVGKIDLSVQPVPAATIAISPSAATIGQGDTQQLTVVVQDAQGATLTGRTVQFTSADTSRVTVSGVGLITAVGSAGNVTVTARSEGVSTTHTVTLRCSASPLVFGATINGTLTSVDCPSGSAGRQQDNFRFTTTRATIVRYSVAASATLTQVFPFAPDTTSGVVAEWTAEASTTPRTSGGVYGVGTFKTVLRQAGTTPTTYSFSGSVDSTYTEGCEFLPVALGSAFSLGHTLNAGSCFDGLWHSNVYAVAVGAGQTLTARMSSTAVDAYLCIATPNGTIISCNNDETPGQGLAARLQYSAPSDTAVIVYASSADPGSRGNYTLELSASSGAGLMAWDRQPTLIFAEGIRRVSNGRQLAMEIRNRRLNDNGINGEIR